MNLLNALRTRARGALLVVVLLFAIAPLALAQRAPSAGTGSPLSQTRSGVPRIGILHSLSGAVADTEGVLKDVALMAIEEINARGGILGTRVEAIAVDPASQWPLFAEKARQLLAQHKVDVVFGCWTSVSRKAVLPVFQELNGLLFYPAPYEGEELSRYVFYTGATPNQLAIPAAEHLMSREGGGATRWVLIGNDYVLPRVTNKILRAFLSSKGVGERDIIEGYMPFGPYDYRGAAATIKTFAAGGKTAVISTLLGDSNVPFHQELANQGLTSANLRVLSLSIGEEELRNLDARPLAGHLAAANYFMSLGNPENDEFKQKWADYAKAKDLAGQKDKPLTTDAMVATYVGINLWKLAVERAGSFDVERVAAAMSGQTLRSPTGDELKMDEKNHHLQKPLFIGEVMANGQFNVLWKTPGPIKAQPWSQYIAGNEYKKDEP
ncbi:MAG: ABC transporter substrate-binding protein [Betaproteobacteria bacterium]|nr:ABC transporter substrate-binding protein [Betaproteobacteria bacterium]